MATVIIMPKQGQSVESCILTEMKKKKGSLLSCPLSILESHHY